jgi:hypothetical protein
MLLAPSRSGGRNRNHSWPVALIGAEPGQRSAGQGSGLLDRAATRMLEVPTAPRTIERRGDGVLVRRMPASANTRIGPAL